MIFTFKGISSESMHIKVISMSGIQRAPCETEQIIIPGRCEPMFHEKPERQATEITAELFVEKPENIRQIFAWLNGKGRLVFSDEPDKYYNVISNDVISVQRIGDEIQSFEIKFICEPFAYSVDNPLYQPEIYLNDSKLSATFNITYEGTVEGTPLLFFALAGKLKMTVNGGEPFIVETSGNITEITTDGISTPRYEYKKMEYIYVDCSALIAYDSEKNVLTKMTSGKFPTFTKGTNEVVLELSSDEIYVLSTACLPYNQRLEAFDYKKNERWY